jgi:uncharacterized protein
MEHPTDPAAAGLRVKTSGEVQDILRQLRRSLEALYRRRLCGLYLFGSYARNDAGPGSDLDVLVVLDSLGSYSREIERTSHLRAELSLEHDTTVSLVYVSEDDWRRKASPFLLNVHREGLAA